MAWARPPSSAWEFSLVWNSAQWVLLTRVHWIALLGLTILPLFAHTSGRELLIGAASRISPGVHSHTRSSGPLLADNRVNHVSYHAVRFAPWSTMQPVKSSRRLGKRSANRKALSRTAKAAAWRQSCCRVGSRFTAESVFSAAGIFGDISKWATDQRRRIWQPFPGGPYRRVASIGSGVQHHSAIRCFSSSTNVLSVSGAASVTAQIVRPLAPQPYKLNPSF